MARPPEYFRAGVGAVIVGGDGRVLVFERRDVAGAWQFPQGGLERGERPLDAVYREIREETGIRRRALRLLARHPDLLAYELPPRARSKKTGLGQVQYWFLFQSTALPEPPPDRAEFRAVKRMSFAQAIARTVPFRRPVYLKLLDEFGAIVARLRSSRWNGDRAR